MTVSIAMIFPGQGSQSQGMQADLAESFPFVRETYAAASEVLGYDLWQLVQDGPADKLGETVVTQPAMLTAGYVAWLAWQASEGAAPEQMAGHSLGEYTALVCAGALDFVAGLKVVKKRSELMQAAVPVGAGAMAAVIGLDDDAVITACDSASGAGVVEAVNFNSPGQVVIAGEKDAVNAAVQNAQDAGARRAILLPVSVPSHSSLMNEAGRELPKLLPQQNSRRRLSQSSTRPTLRHTSMPTTFAIDWRYRYTGPCAGLIRSMRCLARVRLHSSNAAPAKCLQDSCDASIVRFPLAPSTRRVASIRPCNYRTRL